MQRPCHNPRYLSQKNCECLWKAAIISFHWPLVYDEAEFNFIVLVHEKFLVRAPTRSAACVPAAIARVKLCSAGFLRLEC